MNTKVIYGIIAVVIVLIIAFFVFNKPDATQTESETSNTNSEDTLDNEDTTVDTTPEATTNPPATQPDPPTGEPVVPDGNDVAVFEIAYDGKAFSPSQLTIKNGDVVIFMNNSDKSFWPASGPHPVHTNYPEFDAKKAIAPGQKFQFKFTKTGEWPFHDHLNSSVFGKIIVQ